MSGQAPASSNPFSTRFTRPGALPYLLPPGVDWAQLPIRLRDQAWMGQIVGPHGTGKSSFLVALLPALAAAGRQCVEAQLHGGQRRLPPGLDSRRWTADTQLVVDGYEQLNRWARWRLRRAIARCGGGLLVTTHSSVGLPTLWTTEPSSELLAALVARLLGQASLGACQRAVVERLFARSRGNLREALFDLYDLYERRQWPAADAAEM
jgi:hypothetical protein